MVEYSLKKKINNEKFSDNSFVLLGVGFPIRGLYLYLYFELYLWLWTRSMLRLHKRPNFKNTKSKIFSRPIFDSPFSETTFEWDRIQERRVDNDDRMANANLITLKQVANAIPSPSKKVFTQPEENDSDDQMAHANLSSPNYAFTQLENNKSRR